MDYFRVASIIKPHGVRGEVKVYPLTDDVSRFKHLREAYIERSGEYQPISIVGAKLMKECVVLQIAGFTTPEQAEQLRGLYLCVDREHAVKLPEGCYFVSDMIGCSVLSTDGLLLGELTDVLETNANDVYVIRGEHSMLVPALKKLINTVDISAKRIILNADVLSEVALLED